MALINNIYILADEESVENEVETVTHPTESGMPIADTIRRKPILLNLTGVVADTSRVDADTAIEKITALQKKGSLVKYIGACGTINNLQIQSFVPSYTHKVHGGAKYDMTLKEVQIAKSAYVKQAIVKTTTVVKKNFSVGDIVLFLGGDVFLTSTAPKRTAYKLKSTCKITKISTAKEAIHPYHVISTDGRNVYGWVNGDKLSSASAGTKLAAVAKIGLQQKKMESPTSVRHTVKRGDTLYNLVNVTYKSLNTTVAKVLKDNPHAFTNPKNASTLKVYSIITLYKE